MNRKYFNKRRRGFVLLMVLMIIVLVALLLAGFASHSMNCAFDSAKAQQDMQSRWAIASCQRAGCDIGGQIWLSPPDRQAQDKNYQSRFDFSVLLNGQYLDVSIENESMKLDINTAYEMLGQSRSAVMIERAINQADARVDFQELAGDEFELSAAFRAFLSFDQVFCNENGEPLSAASIRQLATQFTLWGGKIDFNYAQEQLIRDVASELVGPIIAGRLVNARSDRSDFESFQDVLLAIDVNDQQAEKLNSIFGDKTSTISVWVTPRTNEGTEEMTLMVRRRFADSINRYYVYQW